MIVVPVCNSTVLCAIYDAGGAIMTGAKLPTAPQPVGRVGRFVVRADRCRRQLYTLSTGLLSLYRTG